MYVSFEMCIRDRVCGVGLICLAAAKGDGDHTLAGVDERTADVGCANVGVIIGVPQPNGLGVQRFGDFDGIRPLAKNRTCLLYTSRCV